VHVVSIAVDRVKIWEAAFAEGCILAIQPYMAPMQYIPIHAFTDTCILAITPPPPHPTKSNRHTHNWPDAAEVAAAPLQ
jgi:hypothetical protein